jgi:hypothetical protein
METTERIVEAYVRYVRGCFTLPNLKCDGRREIDLLAIKVQRGSCVERFHIESGVSTSGPFSRLTNRPFSVSDLRTRGKQPGQRRTLGYFEQCKFDPPGVVTRLAQFGFEPGHYAKVVVTWGWDTEAATAASAKGIALWAFRAMLREMMESVGAGVRTSRTIRCVRST